MKSGLTLITLLIFGIGITQAQSIIVSEINYHSDTTMNSGDWFEIYNAGTSTVNLGGWKVSDNNDLSEYIIPTGTSLQAGKYLVIVKDIVRFTTIYPGVTNYIGAFLFSLGNSSDMIRLYNQGGTLVYSVTYMDTLGWPKGADGRGRTLEYKGGGLDPNIYSSWFDGCMFGSPGTGWTPCNPSIVISEINYKSDTAYDCDDWFELHNETNATINLTGWRLSDSKDSNQFVIPVVSFPANAYLVFARKINKFSAIHPTVTNVIGGLGFSLSNGGESIRLYDAQGKINFSVHYRNSYGWPVEADGGGYTLELIDPKGKMNEASNWKKGCFLGSPGKAFNPNDCLPNTVETIYHDMLTSVQVINNKEILIRSQSDRELTLLVSDMSGRTLLSDAFYGQKRYTTQLPTGFYIVTVSDGYTHQNVKVVLQP